MSGAWRRPDLLADPAVAAFDPALDSVLNLNEPADYEAARARPAPEVAVRCFGAVRRGLGTGRNRSPSTRPRSAGAAAAVGLDARRARRRGAATATRSRATPRSPWRPATPSPSSPPTPADERAAVGRTAARLYTRGMADVPGGYFGRALVVDVTDGSAEELALDEQTLRRYVGGVGLGTYLHAPPRAARASTRWPPRRRSRSSSRPLVGTPLTTSAKFAVVAKSPLTDRLNDALSSSHFALAGKRTGFDALVVIGARDDALGPARRRRCGSALEPAADLWGLPAAEAEARLRERLGPRWRIAAIGPAGEQLRALRDRSATTAATPAAAGSARCWGPSGSRRSRSARPQRSARSPTPAAWSRRPGTCRGARSARRRRSTASWARSPTCSPSTALDACRRATSRRRTFEGAPTPRRRGARTRRAAWPRHRARPARSAASTSTPTRTAGRCALEYETSSRSARCAASSDPDVVLAAGAALRRARPRHDLGRRHDRLRHGVRRAGPARRAVAALRRRRRAAARARRDRPRAEGLGDLLAEGTRRAAAAVGGDAADFAPHVKGLELPGYEPRALQAMALGFAVGTRGADHNRSGAYEADFSRRGRPPRTAAPRTPRPAIETEDRAALMDSLILCKFLRGVFADLYAEGRELLGAVTGWDVDGDELRATARADRARQAAVQPPRGLDARRGHAARALPRRSRSSSSRAASAALTPEQLHTMIDAYYDRPRARRRRPARRGAARGARPGRPRPLRAMGARASFSPSARWPTRWPASARRAGPRRGGRARRRARARPRRARARAARPAGLRPLDRRRVRGARRRHLRRVRGPAGIPRASPARWRWARAGDRRGRPGAAVAIPTGAVLPAGADAVVMVEHTQRGDGRHGRGRCARWRPARASCAPTRTRAAATSWCPPGRPLRAPGPRAARRRGRDRARASTRVRASRSSRPATRSCPGARRRCGRAGARRHRAALAALVREAGGEPVPRGIVADDRAALERALAAAVAECRRRRRLAGSSVGARDETAAVVARSGDRHLCHGLGDQAGQADAAGRVRRRAPWSACPATRARRSSSSASSACRSCARAAAVTSRPPSRDACARLDRDLPSAAGRLDVVQVRVRDGVATPAVRLLRAARPCSPPPTASSPCPSRATGLAGGAEVEVTLYRLTPRSSATARPRRPWPRGSSACAAAGCPARRGGEWRSAEAARPRDRRAGVGDALLARLRRRGDGRHRRARGRHGRRDARRRRGWCPALRGGRHRRRAARGLRRGRHARARALGRRRAPRCARRRRRASTCARSARTSARPSCCCPRATGCGPSTSPPRPPPAHTDAARCAARRTWSSSRPATRSARSARDPAPGELLDTNSLMLAGAGARGRLHGRVARRSCPTIRSGSRAAVRDAARRAPTS